MSGGIPCPRCASGLSAVVDSRPRPNAIYRRRKCFKCGHRYSTHEVYEGAIPKDVRKKVEDLFEYAKEFLEDTEPHVW